MRRPSQDRYFKECGSLALKLETRRLDRILKVSKLPPPLDVSIRSLHRYDNPEVALATNQ